MYCRVDAELPIITQNGMHFYLSNLLNYWFICFHSMVFSI